MVHHEFIIEYYFSNDKYFGRKQYLMNLVHIAYHFDVIPDILQNWSGLLFQCVTSSIQARLLRHRGLIYRISKHWQKTQLLSRLLKSLLKIWKWHTKSLQYISFPLIIPLLFPSPDIYLHSLVFIFFILLLNFFLHKLK